MQAAQFRRFVQRVLTVFAFLVVLGPFVWTLLLSVQGWAEVNSSYALLLPRRLHLENYINVLTNSTVLKGLANSFVIALLSTVFNLLISVPAGFAMARVKTPLTRAFLRIMLMFVFVPLLLLMLPVRQMLSAWGLQNTYLMTALPMSALVMTALIFWTFYARFPEEIDDCAALMGMTPIHSFWRIYLPVSGRVALYAGIVQFITTWNCGFIPIFMYRGPGEIVTIQKALLQFTLNPGRIFLGMVAVLVCCLPCWLLTIVRHRIEIVHVPVADPFRNSN